jgi:hypothetical protein
MNPTAEDRVDMQRSTEESMESHGRIFRGFRSNCLKNNQLSLARFSDLNQGELANRLDRLADVRKAAVARGKNLISNPHYPDTVVMEKIGRLLADKLR